MTALQAAVVAALGTPRQINFSAAGSPGPLPPATVQVEPEKDTVSDSSRDLKANTGAVGLNPRNTFESFVIGPNNEIAHAASLAVAQSPARTYNPLFIYGGVGLGKTHLMQAIGQYIRAKKKSTKGMDLSGEPFINEFIDAIQNNNLVKFRKRYRQAELLLIDDIQFLGGKERSQEEFFHTFNTLFDGHKQIVLSSDRPASEIRTLEQRLVSRFEWGLTAELPPPDNQTRMALRKKKGEAVMAILKKKAESMKVRIQADIVEFLSSRIRTNVRRLEGALMRVASYVSLNDGHMPPPERLEHLLKDLLQEEARRTVTIDHIKTRVADPREVRLPDK